MTYLNQQTKERQDAHNLIYIIVLGLSFRFFLFYLLSHNWSFAYFADSQYYISLAEELNNHLRFSSLLRTPGYPAFLAFIFLFSKSTSLILFFQILFDCGSIVLIYLISQRFVSIKYAQFTALVYAINPLLAIYTTVVLSETLFVFFLLASLLFLLNYPHGNHKSKLIYSSILLGLATLIKPVSLYLTVIFILFILFNKGNRKSFLSPALSFIAPFSIMIFAWMTYNYTTKGYFVFSTSAATNVIGRHAVYALSSSQDITIEAAEQQLFDSMLESSLADSNSFSNWNENPTFLKENLDFAQEMILTHWKGYATSYTIGLMRTVFSPPVGLSIASHYFPGSTKIDEADIGDVQNTVLKSPIQVSRSFKKRLQNMSSPAIVFFMFGITYMFGLYHVFFRPVLWQRSNLREIWILIATILYFIVVTGPMGHARFRVPIEPFLIILFSYTLYKAARRTLDDG